MDAPSPLKFQNLNLLIDLIMKKIFMKNYYMNVS